MENKKESFWNCCRSKNSKRRVVNEVKELEDTIKKLFEEQQSTQKNKKNKVRMRQPESSINQNFIKNENVLKDERFNSVVSLSKAIYRNKRRADRNYIYFKLDELMDEDNTIEN